jgi:hypothetical protein
MGWKVVKNKELEKSDSWEEESWNINLVDEEDCWDQNHM